MTGRDRTGVPLPAGTAPNAGTAGRGKAAPAVPVLYHFTCDHGAAGIRRDGVLKPVRMQPHDPARLDRPELDFLINLIWMTDIEDGLALRDGLGLSMVTLTCDRMQHRFTIAPGQDALITRWSRYARRVPRDVRDHLEAGRLPAHWYVATEPVRVVL